MEASGTTRRRRSGPAAIALAALLAGCATPAVPGRMTARLSEQTLIRDGSALRQAVQVGTVSGGREDDPVMRSNVTNAGFADALTQSLAAHAMLASGAPVFRLDATLVELRRPIGGFALEVTSRIRYRFTRIATGGAIFEREIVAPFTQPFSPIILGPERLQYAVEGSLRENIRRMLVTVVGVDRPG